MHRVCHVAREKMGLERLQLSVRAGLGVEDFYRKAGWAEGGCDVDRLRRSTGRQVKGRRSPPSTPSARPRRPRPQLR
ncbi:hypothetical protein [Streptomyces spinoverrucosus]|uniref:hypothetical protein n=1 Tax=Streptomyces spinoverrucosus TaxID=284043 RepID=UPI001E363565|nr:hypothetical protein [Streptomyces spinoverrucosus]